MKYLLTYDLAASSDYDEAGDILAQLGFSATLPGTEGPFRLPNTTRIGDSGARADSIARDVKSHLARAGIKLTRILVVQVATNALGLPILYGSDD